MIYKPSHPPKWQKYQATLQKIDRRQRFLKKLPPLFVIAGFTSALIILLIFAGIWITQQLSSPHQESPIREKQANKPSAPPSSMKDLRAFFNGAATDSSKLSDSIILYKDGRRFFIRTAIYGKLQKYILRTLNRNRLDSFS